MNHAVSEECNDSFAFVCSHYIQKRTAYIVNIHYSTVIKFKYEVSVTLRITEVFYGQRFSCFCYCQYSMTIIGRIEYRHIRRFKSNELDSVCSRIVIDYVVAIALAVNICVVSASTVKIIVSCAAVKIVISTTSIKIVVSFHS